MSKFLLLSELRSDERGTSAVEYGLILAMIVLAMFAALGGVANQVQSTWNHVSSASQDAVSKSGP